MSGGCGRAVTAPAVSYFGTVAVLDVRPRWLISASHKDFRFKGFCGSDPKHRKFLGNLVLLARGQQEAAFA